MKGMKTLAAYALIALITLVLLEFSSWLLFSAFSGQDYDRAALREQRAARLEALDKVLNPPPGTARALYQFHPYLGYNGRPGAHPWGEQQPPFNAYGMSSLAAHPYPYKKQNDEFVVAVLGGSVADLFANLGEKYVRRIAREQFGLQHPIVLLNLATGGYKQPQQLFHLQFALLAGFEIDAVLNLDGFNDLVLARQNLASGINPLYPSGHHMGLMSKLSGIPDRASIAAMAEYYALHEKEAAWLGLLQDGPLAYSVFAALLGDLASKRSRAQISQLEYRLTEQAQQGLDSAFLGPPLPEADLQTPIQVWQRASRLLYATAKANGLVYLHALQPNQYLEGSKPLSEQEKQSAYNPAHPWGKIVRAAYPALRAAGAELRAEGVPFYDLTQVFAEHPETVYTDDCCHFGDRGNEILAQALLPLMLQEHDKQRR